MNTTIQDIQKQLPEMPDHAVIEIHDDIASDVTRFMEHVGADYGSIFIAALLLEMTERALEIDPQFPAVPKAPPPPAGSNVIPFNRRKRRSLRSKKKGTLRGR